MYRGHDKYNDGDTGLFVSQVVSGGAAMRSGLRTNDRLVRINKKTPKSIEEAVDLMKKSKVSYLIVVVSPIPEYCFSPTLKWLSSDRKPSTPQSRSPKVS